MDCNRINNNGKIIVQFKRETWLEWFCFDLSTYLLYDEKRTYHLPKWYVPCRIKYGKGDVIQCWHMVLFIFVLAFIFLEELVKFNRVLNLKCYFRWLSLNLDNYRDVYPELPYLSDSDFKIISANKS